MRHIQNYKSFNETFNTSITDAPAVTTAKQYYNKLELDIKEYNDNKVKIEKLYTDINPKDFNLLYDDMTLKIEVEKLIGKTDIKAGKDRSALFTNFLLLLDVKRQIIRKGKTQEDDKKALDVLTKSKEGGESSEEDPRIKETEEKMSLNNSDILDLKKKLTKQEKEFNDMVTKETIKLKNSVNIINSQKNNKIQIGNVVSLKK
jgi:hypothetical protein